MIIELSDDEFEILREAFGDVGNDCPVVDWNKFKALGVKLGIFEPELPLTAEELKRREEWRNSSFGKLMSDMLRAQNEYLSKKIIEDINFSKGSQGSAIGSTLRIRLPNDFAVHATRDYQSYQLGEV